MNKIIVILIFILTVSCDSDSSKNNNNPNIPNYSFDIEINLNLPSNTNLQFISNHIVNYSVGARGIVVFNTGSRYVAFDLACPNQPYDTCTNRMTIDGVEAVCECDDSSYNLFSGEGEGQQYTLKQYSVEVLSNRIRVYN